MDSGLQNAACKFFFFFCDFPPAWRHADVDRVDGVYHRMILHVLMKCTIWHQFPVRICNVESRTSSGRTFMLSFVLVRKGVSTPRETCVLSRKLLTRVIDAVQYLHSEAHDSSPTSARAPDSKCRTWMSNWSALTVFILLARRALTSSCGVVCRTSTISSFHGGTGISTLCSPCGSAQAHRV